METPDPRRYMQVASVLRGRVLELSAGDAMPGAKVIAAEFRVSVETASKALRVLASEGLIKRWAGLPYIVL